MPLLRNLVGKQFGPLTVLEREPENSPYNHVRWICSCACDGKTVVVDGCHLVSGHTRSCGCLRKQAGARNFKDCIGQRFGRLVVLQCRGRNKRGGAIWLCLCDCETKVIVSTSALVSGSTRSCGCLYRETRRGRRPIHGMSKTREYRSYHCAKTRCTNPNTRAFVNYGGRGIEFRLPDFVSFFAALGHCPPGQSLHRINNNGHYELGNIKWATRREQSNNRRPNRKRNNRLSTASRQAQTVAHAAQTFNVPLSAVQALQARVAEHVRAHGRPR